MRHKDSIEPLKRVLENAEEVNMVRHEAAEALGSMIDDNDECERTLRKFRVDSERIVRESCDIALDMLEYERSTEFQYANGLRA
jgi:deoxyhypusine monooxygenase